MFFFKSFDSFRSREIEDVWVFAFSCLCAGEAGFCMALTGCTGRAGGFESFFKLQTKHNVANLINKFKYDV